MRSKKNADIAARVRDKVKKLWGRVSGLVNFEETETFNL